jgi:hypothetical protein
MPLLWRLEFAGTNFRRIPHACSHPPADGSIFLIASLLDLGRRLAGADLVQVDPRARNGCAPWTFWSREGFLFSAVNVDGACTRLDLSSEDRGSGPPVIRPAWNVRASPVSADRGMVWGDRVGPSADGSRMTFAIVMTPIETS